MESDEFPKSVFKGQISDYQTISLDEEGEHNVLIAGNLEIHGVQQAVEIPATMTISGGACKAAGEFIVLVQDYGIEIPSVVRENIAKEIKIAINADLNKL